LWETLVTVASITEQAIDGTRRVFRALRVPRFRILWLGTLVSFLAMQMQLVARGYLTYDLTGSNAGLGAVLLAFGIPRLLFALWGGVVADRMAKRNVLAIWQGSLAAGSALISVAIGTGQVQFWMLLATAALSGVAFAFITPTRQAFVGDLVPDRWLGNATVLQQASMNGTYVFGPALAGVLIATPFVGMAGVYALTTAGFVASTIALFVLPAGEPERDTEASSAVSDTLDTASYIRRDRPIAALLLLSLIVVAFAFPYSGFLPSIARGVFGTGALGLGLMSAVGAVGALIATLVAAGLTAKRCVWGAQTVAGAAFALTLCAFAVAPSFPVALLALFLAGAFAAGFQSLNSALTMTLTEKQYHGRVQAVMGITWSLFGILSLPLGLLADVAGIRMTLTGMGIVALLAVVVLAAVARRRGIEREAVDRACPPSDGARPAGRAA
jgi:predicted MFS family arabinose efflux permease